MEQVEGVGGRLEETRSGRKRRGKKLWLGNAKHKRNTKETHVLKILLKENTPKTSVRDVNRAS